MARSWLPPPRRPELLARARHIHVGSLFLQDRLRADLAEVFGRAHALGLTTSFDPNWDPSGSWDGGISRILEATDIVLPNREEAWRVAGIAEDLPAARALATRDLVVAMKLGAEGGLVVGRGTSARVDAPHVDVVDTIGAGDAFDAGFLAGWLDDLSPEVCLRLAVACGTLSVRASGGTDGQPSRSEAEALAAEIVARPTSLARSPAER